MLFYREYGKGFPVIILHGLYGSSDNWISIGKKIASTFRVIIPDQRNHGHSFHHKDINFDLLSQDLKEFLDILKIDRCHIIGHSMGGKVAANFAQLYPKRIEKIIFVDIAPVNTKPNKKIIKYHQLIISILADLDLKSFYNRKQLREYLHQKLLSEALVNFLLKNFYYTKDKGMQSRLNICSIKNNINSILGEITIHSPLYHHSLIIKGGNSSYFKVDDFSNIKKKFPNISLEIIDDTTHWLHAEKPKKFYSKSITFLKK